MTDSSLYYFAYGSNMSAEQMAQRCPGATVVGAAALDGFRLAFPRFSAKWQSQVADVLPAPGETVWGVLWEVSEADLLSLDRHEGVAVRAYRRETQTVVPLALPPCEAVLYRVVNPGPEAPPASNYLGTLRLGARQHHLPGYYVAMLDAI